jgi:hypothetical protein
MFGRYFGARFYAPRYFGRGSAAVSLPSDREVYAAIRALLRATRRFDEVTIGRASEETDRPSKTTRTAHIEPIANPSMRVDGAPSRRLNRAEYRLTIASRINDEARALEDIDKLRSVVLNTLLSPSNKAYTSYTIGRLSDLVPVSNPTRARIGFVMEFRGTFSYAVNLRSGYDAA